MNRASQYARPCAECGASLTGTPVATAALHRLDCRPDDGSRQQRLSRFRGDGR